MSREQTEHLFQWVFRGGVTVGIVILGFFLQNSYASFAETRDSMIRLEVQFNDFKEDVKKNDERTQRQLENLQIEIKKQN